MLSSVLCVSLLDIFEFGIVVFRLLLNCIFSMLRSGGSRPRKRKFRGNQFINAAKKPRVADTAVNNETSVSEQSTSTVSASARKIGSQNPQLGTQSKPDVTGYRLIDMELLELFTQTVCKECFNSSLVVEDEERERKGSASHLRVRCEDCGWAFTSYTSKRVQHSFDINRRFVYAMRSIGQGHASMKRFCSYMNMHHHCPTNHTMLLMLPCQKLQNLWL